MGTSCEKSQNLFFGSLISIWNAQTWLLSLNNRLRLVKQNFWLICVHNAFVAVVIFKVWEKMLQWQTTFTLRFRVSNDLWFVQVNSSCSDAILVVTAGESNLPVSRFDSLAWKINIRFDSHLIHCVDTLAWKTKKDESLIEILNISEIISFSIQVVSSVDVSLFITYLSCIRSFVHFAFSLVLMLFSKAVERSLYSLSPFYFIRLQYNLNLFE